MKIHRRTAGLFGATFFALALATSLFAGRQGVVTTRDGQVLEGDITEADGQVVVRRNGIDQIVERENVSGIDYSTYADRFEEAIAGLEADDIAGRVALAREAFDRHEYELALRAIDQAVEINPLHREARQLQGLISSQMHLEAANADGPQTRPSTRPATRPARRTRGLDEWQINRVRQAELTRGDRVRIQFRDNVRKRFVDSQPGLNFRAFNGRTDVDQAFDILEKGTPDMRDDVIIMNDPAAIHFFGRRLQTAFLQGCATSACHGGPDAGAFRLLSGPTDNSTTVTNFYLLNNYIKKLEVAPDDKFSATEAPLVARGSGRDALLFQYALPRRNAKLKHPEVKGWDGILKAPNTRLERELVEWLDVHLPRVHAPYGIEFSFGQSEPDATTVPATGPSEDEPTTMPTTDAGEESTR